MINRWIEKDLIQTLKKLGIGCIAFSPLAQGMLSDKYLKKIPKVSRVADNSSLDMKLITKKYLNNLKNLIKIAKKREQTLPQMALSWVLRHPTMTSALIGARTVKQLDDCLDSQNNLRFSKTELKEIDKFATDQNINLWSTSSSY